MSPQEETLQLVNLATLSDVATKRQKFLIAIAATAAQDPNDARLARARTIVESLTKNLNWQLQMWDASEQLMN